ncbi:MAG: hypothetical protein U1E66_02535 [Rhodospirillales bacterium]
MPARALRHRLSRLVLLLPALAACDKVPITSVAFRIEDPWAIAQGAMPLPVAVIGHPFVGPPARFDETVVRTMGEAITWNRGARFVLVPAESIGAGLRIITVFDDSDRGASLAHCGQLADSVEIGAGTPPPQNGTGGVKIGGVKIRMQAVFCDGDRLLADVSGRLGRADGPDDGPFLALVRQVTGDLLRPPPAPRP